MADQQLYCICRSRDDGRFMLACDHCENWFHGECVNISRHRGKHLTTWYCDSCVALHGMPPKMADELAAEISSSTEDESSQSSASSSVSESAQSNDVAVEAATKEKKRKTPSSTSRRSSGGARVKRIAPALDAEAAQRRDELRARTRDRLIDVLLPAVSEAVVAAMNAMLAGAATVGGAVSDSDARNVAVAVEACLFEQCGGVADNQYVGKARSLLFNLKTVDNAPLRISLVRGQITPLQLCNMSAKDMAPARLAESIKRFEQQSMSQHVITAEVAAEKFKKTDVHGNQSLSDKGARRVERAVDAEQRNGDAINDSVSLHASVEVRDAADAGFGDANDAATAPVEHAPTVSIGRIKSFEDFNDDGSLDGDATTNLDNVDEDDDAAALLDPESDVAHFGRRSSGGIDRVNSNADDVEPYTPPGTPPPLTPSDDEQEEAGVGKSSRPSVNAQTALFGVNIDMDNLRADGTLNCRGKLPLTVVRALSPKMSVVGRMEMDKCDSYLEALSTSSSRDRALCFVSASSADARDKLARIAQTLRERSRVGVVKLAKSNPNLRECFLIPWNGTDPLPSFLTRFPTLVPQLSDDAPLIVVLVLSKQPGASGIASGLLTSDGAVPTPVVRAAPPVVRAPQPSVATVMAPPPVPAPTAPLNVGGGGAASLSSALSSLAASLASGGGASLLAAMRGGAQPQPPPQQPQQLHPQPHQQLQPQQQVLPHQLHQQHLQQQQQMRQQHILQMQQQQQQQHHHFMPQQHQPPPQQQQQHLPPLLPRPNAPLLPLPVDPRTGLPLPRNPPQHGW